MNRTIDINLGGRMFHVDESAYRLLYDYLYNLRHAFERQEGGSEIMDDLESRLAELLLERVSDRQEVVSQNIVEEAIARLGKPEEITGGSAAEPEEKPRQEPEEATEEKPEQENTGNRQTPPPPPPAPETPTRKRLFRDPDNRMLGGVLGGLALYLNWDPTLLRLLLLVILVAGYGTVIPIYLVCWLVIPKAVTAADKLSMRGRPVTMENIGKIVTNGMESAGEYLRSDKPRTALQRLADGFVAVAGFLLKVALVILAILCSPVLLLLLIVFFACIMAFAAVAIGGTASLAQFYPGLLTVDTVETAWNLAFYISLTLGSVLLLTCFVSGIFTLAFHWKGLTTRTLKVMLALAVICFVVAGISAVVCGFQPLPFDVIFLPDLLEV